MVGTLLPYSQMDTVSRDKRSDIMRRIKGRETSLEKKLKDALWEKGIHYTKNNLSLFGKPDLLIKKRKLVIFVDSCFWHGCRYHCRMPSSNLLYWREKITKNKARDKKVNKFYKDNGWNILRFWEHKIKSQPKEVIEIVERYLDRNQQI